MDATLTILNSGTIFLNTTSIVLALILLHASSILLDARTILDTISILIDATSFLLTFAVLEDEISTFCLTARDVLTKHLMDQFS